MILGQLSLASSVVQIRELGGVEDFIKKIFEVTEDQDNEENQQSTVEYMADQSASPGKSSCINTHVKISLK